MLAGTVLGWLRGYARFDITTTVWLIVLAIPDYHRAVAGLPRVLVPPS
jgi:hypothetical protein